MNSFYLGLDLAQSSDYSALCIAERVVPQGEKYVDRAGELRERKAGEPGYEFRHIERFPHGIAYTDLVRTIGGMVRDPKLAGNYVIICDGTGVGRPVFDMLLEARLNVVPVTITGGLAVTTRDAYLHVPKRELVSVLAILFQGKRIKFAASLPHTQLLIQEMLSFKAEISRNGHDSYEGRQGAHDDLVCAAALPCWYGERMGGLEVW